MSKAGSAAKVKLNSFDDLFGSGGNTSAGDIRLIPLSELHEFKNHPFRVVDDAAMQELVDSVKEKGVISPGICRPDGAGGYEVISGHRRKHACELAGIGEMPFLVQDIGDDDATVIMVDANLQREEILPSEKAKAYRMKQEAMAHQGRKDDRTTAEMIGEAGGDSGRTVQRYIRLTNLSENLLSCVDAGKIPLGAGEALSYLSEGEQSWLEEAMETLHVYPSTAQANALKEASGNGQLASMASVYLVLKKDASRDRGSQKVILQFGKLKHFFPEAYTAEQIEKVIYQLLEEWRDREE